MRIRDKLRIDSFGLDEVVKDGVPVERPAQNGPYVGRCQVREVPPPSYEPSSYLWGNKQHAAKITCSKCSKEKPANRFAFTQRSKPDPWCLSCRDAHPDEWRERIAAIRRKGTQAYRDRQLAALARRRNRGK